jgi:chromosome partitioning protein
MKIVAIASGKGGSCKSTTTLSLAAVLSEKKYKVLVADTDPQGSLDWVADRSEAEFDVVSETDQKVLARFREIGGYDFLLCDTPPALASEALEVTVKLSDFAVLPSPTSPLDIRELTRTIKQVIAPSGTPYRVLLARVDSRRLKRR